MAKLEKYDVSHEEREFLIDVNDSAAGHRLVVGEKRLPFLAQHAAEEWVHR
jgi:hypothetical protein